MVLHFMFMGLICFVEEKNVVYSQWSTNYYRLKQEVTRGVSTHPPFVKVGVKTSS